MTKAKTTKRALLVSALSMLLCVAMLVGSTYAWFTDSVTSGKNRIVAGNLDVELYVVDGENETPVDKDTNLFMKDALWEPGHVEVVNLKIANLGSLALKYNLGINVANEKGGTNVAGETFKLSDYIMFALIEGNNTYKTREAALAAADNKAVKLSALAVDENGVLYPAEKATEENPASRYVTLVVYMPTTVGNEANYKTGTAAPTIDLGVTLLATQAAVEEDSFDEKYDENVKLPDVVVSTTASLADAVKNAEAGTVIQLAAGNYENVGEFVVDKDLTLIGEDGAIMKDAVVQIKAQANVAIENIDFAGDSYIHNQGMKSLTMKDCEVDVNVPGQVNNGRAAFISLGSSETTYGVKLDIQDNTFKVKSNADGFVAAIFGWAYIDDNSVIRGNTFGSEDSRYKFIALKLMNFVDGAAVTISDNTVYGSIDSWYFYAFDLYQNNSRANQYNADFSGNTVDVTGERYEGFFLCLEANNGVNSATVNIGGTNTYNGQTVSEDNCDIEEGAGSINFIIVDEGDFEDPFS